MHVAAGIILTGFALFLLGFTVTSFVQRALAERFLLSFASSARTHFAEQTVRLIVGLALVGYAERMWNPPVFFTLGWVIVVTAIGLMCLPWRVHQRVAQRVVPPAIKRLRVYALLVGAFAAALLTAMALGA